jgi:hypothetical protein
MRANAGVTRREFLQATGLSAAGLWSGAKSAPTSSAADFLEIALHATQFEASLLPGALTRVWGYRGTVLSGDPASLQPVIDPNPRYPTRLPSRVGLDLQAPSRRARAPLTYLVLQREMNHFGFLLFRFSNLSVRLR